MSLIQLKNVSLRFGAHPLLDKVNFTLNPQERVCILGRNGMGKSTLLKLLSGDILADEGEIIRQQNLKIARLAQELPVRLEASVYEVVALGLGEKGQLLGQYQSLSQALSQGQNPALLNQYHSLHQALEHHQAWNVEPQIQATLDLLKLEGNRPFSALSGGLKRRVLLGQALVQQPDVILLDEPTNHLDIPGIEWLEDWAKCFKGSLIFITHDRQFLQAIATKIVELDRGKLSVYPNDYQTYLQRKEEALTIEEAQNKAFDKKLAEEERWVRQGIKARRTRNEGRVRALKALRQERSERRNKMGQVKLNAQQGELSGKIVLEAHKISFNFDGKPLFHTFSTQILRGDKIGLIGENGSGKSTLLKILLGELTPSTGYVKQGTQLQIAYFDQLRAQLDEEKTVAQNISQGDLYVKIDGRSVHVMTYLQDFLFEPDRARTPVKALSGGERNRLLLARLFSQPANLLVLDEPTNDLDVETLELLENLLVDYPGTVILVSHDRYFLDQVVSSTLVFEGDGQIEEYVGGYDDWLRQRPQMITPPISPPKTNPNSPTVDKEKNNYHRQKEIRGIEQKIEKLEKRAREIESALGNSELYTHPNQGANLEKFQAESAEIKNQLGALYTQWENMMS